MERDGFQILEAVFVIMTDLPEIDDLEPLNSDDQFGVRAFQLTKSTRWDNRDWPNWMNEAWQKDRDEVNSLSPLFRFPWYQNSPSCSDELVIRVRVCSDELAITAVDGMVLVNLGDWIVRDKAGNINACKPSDYDP